MTRQHLMLTVLAALLVLAGFWFLLFQPSQDELATLETQVSDVQAQQVVAEQRIAELEAVRAEAPAIEAALVGATSLVPGDTALPATMRQIQAAADDAGLRLTTLNPGTPAPVAVEGDAAAPADLAQINLNIVGEGTYFQVVDLLRRLEAPEIVSRGIVVDGVTVAPDEYPTLTVTITARMFANVVPGPDPTVVEEDAEATDTEATGTGATDPDADGSTDGSTDDGTEPTTDEGSEPAVEADAT